MFFLVLLLLTGIRAYKNVHYFDFLFYNLIPLTVMEYPREKLRKGNKKQLFFF